MRINTVDEKYIMIRSDEISNILLDLKKRINGNSESKNQLDYITKLYEVIKEYFFENHYVPTEVAIKSDLDVTKSFLENIDDTISLRDMHNSFMYSIMKNDVEKTNILYNFIREHKIKTYYCVEKEYGNEVASYIRTNKNYDYIDNVNRVNRKDSSILLFDGEKLEIKNLVDVELLLQYKM